MARPTTPAPGTADALQLLVAYSTGDIASAARQVQDLHAGDFQVLAAVVANLCELVAHTAGDNLPALVEQVQAQLGSAER